ncbi:MAG TPA: porin family protein [Epsilonproteobacteria bacterium]|nr:porin family protein [Campylobacterota bacterium]
MKRVVNTVAFLAIASNFVVAGGDFSAPVEPEVNIPEKEVVVVDDNVKYDGFYAGGALSYLRMNAITESRGHALTLLGGYYFNKYIGLEGRYTRTLTDIDEDTGANINSRSRVLSNLGIYLKPMYNFTTGFSTYGLAGYGKAKAGGLSESGLQWGLGSKYELANGLGIFFDYVNFYNGDNFDGVVAKDAFFSGTTVGATYTF